MKDAKLTLVLMAGLPGAGKSTLAGALSRDLEWHVIDKDRYKQELRNKGWDDEMAGKAAYEQSFTKVRHVLLKQNLSVILDCGTFYHSTLDNADIACKIANAQLKAILGVVDRDLRNERLRKRSWPPVTNNTADPATIADYLQCFKHLPSDRLTLYTNKPLEQCLIIAREYLQC